MGKKILTLDYSITRIVRKVLFILASELPVFPGKYRALFFSWGGVKFKAPLSCFIGKNVYFDDLHPELISVGERTIITEGSRILTHFLDVNFNDFDHQYLGEVKIGNNVFIGMNTVIVKPIIIGDGAIIGANSVINKDIPPYTIWGGNPAKFIKNRKMKKIYIAGCGGMLGEAFYTQFKEDYEIKCTDKDVNEKWLSFLDFRDFDSYKKDVLEFQPDYLFHLGAYTDLEFCEEHPEDTYLTNTLAVENAVYIANELNIPVLYISTAGIFDGKKEFYDDWDLPNPLGVYARSKYMGERFVIENADRYLVCRAGWMMGSGPKKDKKFIQKLMKQLKEGKKELFIVDDKDGTPTYTHDFAKTVKALIEKEYWGLYNTVCGGQTSRLEVAKELIKILNPSSKIKITPVHSDYFKEEYYADRPASERLLTKKLDLRGVNKMRDWKISLKEYIDNYYKNYL